MHTLSFRATSSARAFGDDRTWKPKEGGRPEKKGGREGGSASRTQRDLGGGGSAEGVWEWRLGGGRGETILSTMVLWKVTVAER